MNLSVFDLFRIGIGPSSSHTVGPMRAAMAFRKGLLEGPRPKEIGVILYGSLAHTGAGHRTDRALLYGLLGYDPETIDIDEADSDVVGVSVKRSIRIGRDEATFDPSRCIEWAKGQSLPEHPNALSLWAELAGGGKVIRTFFSVGGGFIVERGESSSASGRSRPEHPFDNAQDLLVVASKSGLRIPELIRFNELCWQDRKSLEAGLDKIWACMNQCIERGLSAQGTLPGGLNVKRRAASLYKQLLEYAQPKGPPPSPTDWASTYAIAVNEENAAGHRIVTAPTNGAAGVVPAVLRYYVEFCSGTRQGVHDFLLAAAAIGAIVKRNASISGAEVGCQGEVGSACGMAAAGLTAALGGTNSQIENAAEIGIEHHLGMSCDPIGGLVQVPCIERNAMGAAKAISACSLAMRGDGEHIVSLDAAIATMRETGKDMNMKYKETSLGGLAARIKVVMPEC